ncbi:MAG: PAS domain S-box protein [Methanobacteriaceae archaeon]|nr:PAS domain S-box protein [Methanobacteriaceae archaeon]
MVKLTLVDQDANEINHSVFQKDAFYMASEYINEDYDKATVDGQTRNLINSMDYNIDVLIPWNNGEDFIITKPNALAELLLKYGGLDDPLSLEGRLFHKVLPKLGELAYPEIFRQVLAAGTFYHCRLLEFFKKDVIESYDQVVVPYNGNILLLTKRETEFDLVFQQEEHDLFETAPSPMAIIYQGKFVRTNSKFLSLVSDFQDRNIELSDLNVEYFFTNKNFEFEGEKTTQALQTFIQIQDRDVYSHVWTLKRRFTNGTYKWLRVQGIPVNYRNKPAVQVVCEDITERKLAEERAFILEEDLQVVADDGLVAVMHWDPINGFRYTDEIYNIIEERPEDVEPGSDLIISNLYGEIEEQMRVRRLIQKTIDEKSSFSTQIDLQTKVGIKNITFSVHCYGPEVNGVPYSTGFIQDITDVVQLRRSYEDLEISLEDKNVILRELYQRFKNNLQIILSFLSLDMRFNPDDPDKVVESTRDRINSMVLINESMYHSSDLVHVNMAHYLESEVISLLSSHRAGHVRPMVDVDAPEFTMEETIPVGLLVSEFLLNSIEHAWDEGDSGTFLVSLKTVGEHVTLIVADNGKGLPKDFDIDSAFSLGFTIISSLVDQLEGTIVRLDQMGTAFQVDFERFENSKDLS